jgi:hypothetical protein
MKMKIDAFSTDIDDFIVLTVAAYDVDRDAFIDLELARSNVSPVVVTNGNNDMTSREMHSASYGYKYWKLLTRELAATLTGKTVPAISGQNWMDDVPDGSLKERTSHIALHTIHGLFTRTRRHTGCFSCFCPPSTTLQEVCIISEIDNGSKKVHTFQTYEYDGHFGSGGSHDSIYVFDCMLPYKKIDIYKPTRTQDE